MEPAISDAPMAEVLTGLGTVFAVFDARTQDSGHVSYGVEGADGRRWFVKTSGGPQDSPGGTTDESRRRALRRSAVVSNAVVHPALLPVQHVVEAPDGVLLVSAWSDGEVLHSPRHRRSDPGEAFCRFQSLPAAEIVTALSAVIDVHVALAAGGWVSGDLYDGSLLYDFGRRTVTLIDLESYRPGAYANTVGRLPGSTRFMAPEEFTRGATIDERTTVFTLGRMIQVFLLAHHDAPGAATVAERATRHDPADRPAGLAELQARWLAATMWCQPGLQLFHHPLN